MCKLDEPKEAGQKVQGVSRIIRNRTMGGFGVNVASDFVLPNSPTEIDPNLLPGLGGVASGDVISVVDETYEYEARPRVHDNGLGWYPNDKPERIEIVQQAKAYWPRNGKPPQWLWQVMSREMSLA